MRRFPNSDAQSDARKRSANGHKKRAAGNVVMVDGAPFTPDEIASRLGVSRGAANKRLAKARTQDGPVSWAGLEGK